MSVLASVERAQPWPAWARARQRIAAAFRSGSASVAAELERQSPRAFVWLVVVFAAGIVAFFTWPTDPPGLLGPAVMLFSFAVAVLARRWRALRVFAWGVLALAAGHTAADVRSRLMATPVLMRTLSSQEIHGRVVEADMRPTSHRIVLDMVTVPGLAAAETPVRIRLTIPAKNGLPKVGDHIAVRAVLRPPMRPSLADGFEFQRALYFMQIGGTGFTFGPWKVEQAAPDGLIDRLSAKLEEIRRYTATRVREAIPDVGDATTTAALIMGEQTAIPDDLQESYRRSGLAHLLSISGVHMSLLAAAVYFIVRRGLALVPFVALRIDGKKIAAWAALAASTFYVLISGLSVPAERSFLMIGVVLIAVQLDRTAISLRTISWSALALMAIYPDAVIGASFEMSFMAVLALIALAEHVRLKVKWRGPDGHLQILRAVWFIFLGLLFTDIAASSATGLYAIYHFNRFPTYSMVSNFLADPITGFWVMPWGLAGMLLMPFGLDHWPLHLMGMGVGWVNTIARVVGDWPGSQVHVPPMSPVALAAGSLGLLVIYLWQSRLKLVGLAMFVLAVAQPWFAQAPDVLMDEEAKVMAITDAHGRLVLAPGHGEKFTRDIWQDRYGASDEIWTAAGDPTSGLRCDSEGCILTCGGRKILIAFTAGALGEDCATVDAAVSFVPGLAFCRHKPLADIIDVRRRGAVAVRAIAEGVEFRYALERVGHRRWSPAPKPFRQTATAPEPAQEPEAVPDDISSGAIIPPDAPVP